MGSRDHSNFDSNSSIHADIKEKQHLPPDMTKKPSNKRRGASSAGEDLAKSVGSAHIKFDFDSHTLARLLVVFHNFTAEDVVYEDHNVSLRVTKRDYLDNAIKFSMMVLKNESEAKVTMHIYPGTQSIMVQGKTGKIMGRPPFVSFTDIFLEPFLTSLAG